jgi:hypothetical protein
MLLTGHPVEYDLRLATLRWKIGETIGKEVLLIDGRFYIEGHQQPMRPHNFV